MRIYGIDASTKSTGLCIMDVEFKESDRDMLFEFLVNPVPTVTNEQKKRFNEVVRVELLTQIEFPKVTNRQLTKVRKRIRDDINAGQPSRVDIEEVDEIVRQRMIEQVHEIVRYQHILEPDLTLIEDYSYNSQGSLTQLAEMKGYLNCHRDFPIFIASIPSIKKIGSTNGNANKRVMYENIQRFPIPVNLDPERDDEIDALAICLSAMYSIYHRVYEFSFKKPENTKERQQQKSWLKCLDRFADHIGNKCDLESLING